MLMTGLPGMTGVAQYLEILAGVIRPDSINVMNMKELPKTRVRKNSVAVLTFPPALAPQTLTQFPEVSGVFI